VRLSEQEADDAIPEANHALEVLPTGQVDTASQIAAAQVRAIAALAGLWTGLQASLTNGSHRLPGTLGRPGSLGTLPSSPARDVSTGTCRCGCR
jgi:hypothetical protein